MRRRTQLAMLALLAACGSDGTGPDGGTVAFAVTTVTPTSGATDVETGALITAHFNAPVAAATLTSTSFTLSTDSTPTPLAVALAYDPTSRTAQLVAPLLPGSTYRAAVTTAVEDTTGRALATAREWTFSTRAWHSVTLDQGGLSSLARDPTGRLHLAYSLIFDLKYATCAGNCTSAANWQAVTLDQGPDRAVLATEASGRLHMSYMHRVLNQPVELRYATCAADCTTVSNWQTLTLDQATQLVMGSSLAADGAGRLHLDYFNSDAGDLKYATCAADCGTTAGNWQTVTVKHLGAAQDLTSLAVDGTGRVHMLYGVLGSLSTPGLAYATCPSDCTAAGNWQAVTIDPTPGVGGSNSLAVDATGRVHVTYSAGLTEVRYATCTVECTTPASWQIVAIDESSWGSGSDALAVDDKGRLHAMYEVGIDFNFGELKYATCVTVCTSAANWQTKDVARIFLTGADADLVVDGAGRVRVSYTSAGLQYSE